MAVLQIPTKLTSLKPSAWDRLAAFLGARRATGKPAADLEAFERELHQMFVAAEAEALGEELEKFDLDAPEVLIDGVAHRRVLRCPQTYLTASGPVSVTRSLYSTRQDGERAVCPLELRAGILEGFWTPVAAKQASWAVAHLVPQEGEAMFALLGGMTPSRSILDRLPKQLSERWEACRTVFETKLQAQERVPRAAVTVAVSLDGVMVPMKDGERQAKRRQAAAEEKHLRGPFGHQEVGCATLTFYDRYGMRLRTIRVGRMPESKKQTLKAMLKAELTTVLCERPDLRIVKIADGARDNWTYLSQELPRGREIVDFYHAAEHLHAALAAAYGETSLKCQAQFAKLRHVLRHEPQGVTKVIRALVYLRDCHPRSKKIGAELGYFRRNRRRMRYESWARRYLPIGSGVTEAACKTLVTQRMKRSGMRWRHAGGQAILTLRGWAQSERFDRAWMLLAGTYKKTVALPAKVTPLPRLRLAAVSV
jgi:hypothetical protein